MKNKELNEWKFEFGLCTTKKDQLIPNSQCKDLLDLIIKWAEKREYNVGGGFRDYPPQKPVDIDSLLAAIDYLWNLFNHCRAHFPCIPKDAIGSKCVKTAPFYRQQGYDISFCFGEALSQEKQKKINDTGHWLNQNSIIRLYSILDSHHVINNIDQTIQGAEYIELIRRLRNSFSHGSGRFNRKNKKHRQTLERMGELLDISIENRTDWPLALDTVLSPLFDKTKAYCVNRYESHNHSLTAGFMGYGK